MHWSNPPHLIPMIEVIPGEQTSQETVDATSELVRRIGYHPVVEREVPGFVENRILYAILRECLDLVDRGIIDPEGLDLNVRWGIGYKLAVIGPMELLDMAGLDIYHAVGSYLNQDLSTSGDVSSTIRDLIDNGPARDEDGRRHLRLHAGADRGAASEAGGQAGRCPEGARGITVKVWLLDGGSIVIEHTQLMWNVPGPQARIPVYSVLIEHDDGLFLIDTGIDLDHMNRVLPFELPEQTEEQTIPAQLALAGFELGDVTTLVNSHLHIDHVGGNQLFDGNRRRARAARAGAGAGARPRAVRVLRLLRQVMGLRGGEVRDGLRRRRAAPRACGCTRRRVTRSAITPCSSRPKGRQPMLFAMDVAYTAAALEKGIQPGFHNDPVAGVRSIARVKDAGGGARRRHLLLARR